MKFKASQKGGRAEKERGMAIATDITYGTPVNLVLGDEVYVDLGAENRGGQSAIVLVLDDGNGAAQLKMTPEQAIVLADVIRGLAQVGS